eukprot:403-Prorocentrum_minimum.AAC.1
MIETAPREFAGESLIIQKYLKKTAGTPPQPKLHRVETRFPECLIAEAPPLPALRPRLLRRPDYTQDPADLAFLIGCPPERPPIRGGHL